jgi:anaerobic ribonucleoside-triphosphate reductase activating protein
VGSVQGRDSARRGEVLRVGARVERTEAEGPGLRYALWLQGCSIRCPGCCNPHLFDETGGSVVSVEALLREVAEALDAPAIEGVTLLGGEPFDQPGPLAHFAEGVRGLGLSVMAFSGFRFDELRARAAVDPEVARLLRSVDVLVDGRYDAAQIEAARKWVGSRNQRFHYLSDRYTPEIERPGPAEALRVVEVRVALGGRLSANGWPVLSRRAR